MVSWSYFIWVKRLLPLVLVAAGVLGYLYYDKTTHTKKLLEDEQKALLTARIWVAGAFYRDEPDRFVSFRDSLLKANYLTPEDMTVYLQAYGDKTEQFNNFTWLVQQYVDSLSNPDLWGTYPDSTADSVKVP
ncbi:MAG: hypothetical protein PHU88_02380 [candidate division Zixibacteria bacterium]|nr:hypothetical protein [candidate division Zixibacteria bacterium]MDD5424975.1 hypothetical protein [candidate division Zixibacteria bacterium]